MAARPPNKDPAASSNFSNAKIWKTRTTRNKVILTVIDEGKENIIKAKKQVQAPNYVTYEFKSICKSNGMM